MKRILSIAIRDFRSSIRDFLALYIIIAPIILAFIMAGFVPATEDASVVILTDGSVEQSILNSIDDYSEIETYADRTSMEKRINATDDRIGLVQKAADTYEIVKEGNEVPGAEALLQNLLIREKSERTGEVAHIVQVEFSDIGVVNSPVAIIGLVSIAIIALVLGGMVVSMNIIEEKESMTFSALNTTPLTRAQFIIGKSLAGSIIAVVQIIACFYIFGFNEVNMLQVLFISVSGLSVVIIMGFVLGLVSPNQMAAMANMKVLFLPISITIVGAVMMPASRHFLLWWSPFYWVYDGMTNIINDTATWGGLLIDAFGVMVITVIVYLIFRKKISANLQSA